MEAAWVCFHDGLQWLNAERVVELLHRPYRNTGGAATSGGIPATIVAFNYDDALLRDMGLPPLEPRERGPGRAPTGCLTWNVRSRARHGLQTQDDRPASAMADHIVVMKQGQIVEVGPTDTILDDPRQPYTKALMAAAIDVTPFRLASR
jgi:hypothetical protein